MTLEGTTSLSFMVGCVNDSGVCRRNIALGGLNEHGVGRDDTVIIVVSLMTMGLIGTTLL